ncbi:MAG: outer membrane lipoprotein-sorting protein [Ignavibacteria bacterium]|jgi:outer membrane lipoprotein-sorting protein
MKFTKLISVFILLLAFGMVSYAQTVDEIINKHVDAIGGMDKLNSIKTVKLSGTSGFGSMDFPFTMTYKLPSAVLMESTIQGMTMKQGYDGETAWMINPFMGSKDPQKMNEEQMKGLKEEADFAGQLVNYKDKGNKIELEGKEDMEGSDTYKLKVTNKDGDVSYYYLDASTYLILKTSTKRKIKEKEINADEYFGDYKSEDGILLAHAMEVKADMGEMGHSQKITIEKFEFNIPVDDSIFKMPEATK